MTMTSLLFSSSSSSDDDEDELELELELLEDFDASFFFSDSEELDLRRYCSMTMTSLFVLLFFFF